MAKGFKHGPGGVIVKRVSGTFTTSSSGRATVDLGFKPDFVHVNINMSEDGWYDSMGAAFTERGQTKLYCSSWTDTEDTYPIMDLSLTQTNTGFSVEAGRWDWDWQYSGFRKGFNYVAVKYT